MIGLNSGLIWAAIGGLLGFGVLYNQLVQWLHRKGYDEGYTSILVVVGVLVTDIGVGVVLGFEAAAVVFLLFCASGSPMILGDIARYVKARARQYPGDDDS